MIRKAMLVMFLLFILTVSGWARQYALLVGVKYPQGGVESPENNVRLIQMHLNRLGVESTVLLGDEATEDRIFRELDSLLNNSQPDNLLLFYYSGAGEGGSRYRVPHGTFTQERLKDDFLNAQSRVFRVAILDACSVIHMGPARFPNIDVLSQLERQVLIKPKELTYESRDLSTFLDGQKVNGFGFLTHSLHQAMSEKLPTHGTQTSLLEIIATADEKYRQSTKEHAPSPGKFEIQGNTDIMRQIVFTATAAPPTPPRSQSSPPLRPARDTEYLTERNVIVKVIGKSLNTFAYQQKSIDSPQAFPLDVMKHYFVLRHDSDEGWLHIRDVLGDQQEGYVRKEGVILWNTREGFMLKRTGPGASTPEISVWKELDKLKKYVKTTDQQYKADYQSFTDFLQKGQSPSAIYPLPLLDQQVLSTDQFGELTAYKVLFPVTSIESLKQAMGGNPTGASLTGKVPKVDMALVIDCSKSMNPYIDLVKLNLKHILEDLKDKIKVTTHLVPLAICVIRDT